MIQYFDFPKWDSFVIIATTLFLLLMLFSCIIVFRVNNIYLYSIPIILFFIVFVTFLHTPVKFGFDEKCVYIKQIKGITEIPFTSIKKVTSFETNNLSNTFRVFGSGGIFGYLGVFKNKELGFFIMYATSKSDLVCIETSSKKYIINCPNKNTFIECFKRNSPSITQQ